MDRDTCVAEAAAALAECAHRRAEREYRQEMTGDIGLPEVSTG